MTIKHAALALTVLLFSLIGIGRGHAQIKKGVKLYEEGRYEEAIKPLRKDFGREETRVEAGIMLAKVYYRLHDYQEALDIVAQIGERNIANADDRRFYADVLVVNDDFSGAYLSLVSLLATDENDIKTYLWMDKVKDLLSWDTIQTKSAVDNMQGINSLYNEYCPYYNKTNNEIWFISDAVNLQSVFPASYTNQNLHLYFKTSIKSKAGNLVQRPGMLMRKRDYYYHDGPLDEWQDGAYKYALTLRDIDAPEVGGRIGIFFSNLTGSEEDVVPFKFNGKYNTGHPTFSNQGKRMIFASDRPGGYGQMDLWYCDWIEDNWTEPVNMGPIINTPYNEVFPNFTDNKLFYSSDRMDIGYGGLDLYYTSHVTGFTSIYNLRAPINSSYDDFGLTFISEDEGYYSSNRKNGEGGDDIYALVFEPEKAIISNGLLRIVEADLPYGTEVEILDEERNAVAKSIVGEGGYIKVSGLKTRTIYILSVKAEVEDKARLLTFSTPDKMQNSFQKSGPKEFTFELLPFEDYGLDEEELEDYALLKYELNGRLVSEDGDILEGVPVVAKNKAGAVMGSTKTLENGSFTIQGLQKGENYILETAGVDKVHEIDIIGESGAIVQSLKPMGDNSFSYTRTAPAAKWMEAANIVVPQVFGIIITNGLEPGDEVRLYDENDIELAAPQPDEDGFVKLGSLMAGKAYRLYLPQKSLKAKDRLIIMDGNGDTSQTVRPFDANNYFFEYMLYRDYGNQQMAEELVIKSEEQPKDLIYKMKIADWNVSEPTLALMRESETGVLLDSVLIASNGIIVLRNLKAGITYEISMEDGKLNGDKDFIVFDGGNKAVFTGRSKDRKFFIFTLLEDEEYALKQENLEDLGLLNISLSGKLKTTEEGTTSLTILTPANEVIAETFTTKSYEFSFKGLSPAKQYVVKSPLEDTTAMLVIAKTGNSDSLRVPRSGDGNFYINMDANVTLKDENEREIVVEEGAKFSLPSVYYSFNSYSLTTEAKASLQTLVKIMADNPGLIIEIQSHTDARGPANYNKLLSQRRAEGVVSHLASMGIGKNRLSSSGFGEEQPVNKCKDGVPCKESDHAANRRTEFVIKGIN